MKMESSRKGTMNSTRTVSKEVSSKNKDEKIK